MDNCNELRKVSKLAQLTWIVFPTLPKIYPESADDTGESSDDSGDEEENGDTSEQGTTATAWKATIYNMYFILPSKWEIYLII